MALGTAKNLLAVDQPDSPSGSQQNHQDSDKTRYETNQRAEMKRLREAEWRIQAASGPHPEIGTGTGMSTSMATSVSTPQPSITAEEILKLQANIDDLTTTLKIERERRGTLEKQLEKCQGIQNQTLNALDEKFLHLIEMNQELEEKAKELGACEMALKTQTEQLECHQNEVLQLRGQLEDSGSELSQAQIVLDEHKADLMNKTQIVDEVSTSCKAIESELLEVKTSLKAEIARSIQTGDELKAATARCLELEAQEALLIANKKRLRSENERLENLVMELQEEASSSESKAKSNEEVIQQLSMQVHELNDQITTIRDMAFKDKDTMSERLEKSVKEQEKSKNKLLRVSAAMEESMKSLLGDLHAKDKELGSMHAQLEKLKADRQRGLDEEAEKQHQAAVEQEKSSTGKAEEDLGLLLNDDIVRLEQEVLRWMEKANERDETIIKLLAEKGGRSSEYPLEVVVIIAEVSGCGYERLLQTYDGLMKALRWRNPNVHVGLIVIDHYRSNKTAHVRYPEPVSRTSGELLRWWFLLPYRWSGGLVDDAQQFGRRMLDKFKLMHNESTSTRIIRLIEPERRTPEDQLVKDCQGYQTNNEPFCLLFTGPIPRSWTYQKADWDKLTNSKTFVMPADWNRNEDCDVFEIEALVGRPARVKKKTPVSTDHPVASGSLARTSRIAI